MNFGIMIEGVREGKKARRAGWNGKKMYIFDFKHSFIRYPEDEYFYAEVFDMIEYGDNIEIGAFDNDNSYKIDNFILLKTAEDTCIPWNASQADMLADDWEFI
jgi:hypothetical protein